jgi:predicted glycoside hydrolase/deacetylase ChbG (UPF0249 family)
VLIINADDLGRSAHETDATLACWQAGVISNATLMVWMADSDRAATLARDAELPTGLHLNLIEPYTGQNVPAEVRERQRGLAMRLGRWTSLTRQMLYAPGLRATIDAVIRDQLERFREIFGAEPTHVDSHHHAHLCPAALASRSLPAGIRVRRGLRFLPGERSLLERAVRETRHALMSRRFRCTDWLLDIRDMHPALGGAGLERKLALAAASNVEVMVHPGVPAEIELLLGDEWRRRAAELRPRSYAALG